MTGKPLCSVVLACVLVLMILTWRSAAWPLPALVFLPIQATAGAWQIFLLSR